MNESAARILWLPRFAYGPFKRLCWRHVWAATFHGLFVRVEWRDIYAGLRRGS